MLELSKAHNADWLPLTWHSYEALDGKRKAYMVDPTGCGLNLANHTIEPDGAVHPSVACQICSFHDYVRLLGWNA